MNTRGSDSTASKIAKTGVNHKASKSEKPTVVVVGAAPQSQTVKPSKPMSSKPIKEAKSPLKKAAKVDPVIVTHAGTASDEPVKRSIFKSTFNTHDIMHAPVEKTIQMLDKILAGERLFTM